MKDDLEELRARVLKLEAESFAIHQMATALVADRNRWVRIARMWVLATLVLGTVASISLYYNFS